MITVICERSSVKITKNISTKVKTECDTLNSVETLHFHHSISVTMTTVTMTTNEAVFFNLSYDIFYFSKRFPLFLSA